MSSLRASVLPAVAAACMLCGACAYGEIRQVVRAQFAAEHDCPEVRIVKRQYWYSYDSPDQFKVSGCGVMRTYTCPKTEGLVSYDEPQCTWVEGDADAPTVEVQKPAAADNDLLSGPDEYADELDEAADTEGRQDEVDEVDEVDAPDLDADQID